MKRPGRAAETQSTKLATRIAARMPIDLWWPRTARICGGPCKLPVASGSSICGGFSSAGHPGNHEKLGPKPVAPTAKLHMATLGRRIWARGDDCGVSGQWSHFCLYTTCLPCCFQSSNGFHRSVRGCGARYLSTGSLWPHSIDPRTGSATRSPGQRDVSSPAAQGA